MIVITNRIPVAIGHESAFEERFAARVGKVEGAEGFVRSEIARPLPMRRDPERGWVEAKADSSIYEVRTYWHSFDAFAAWTASPAFTEAHKERPPQEMFAGQHQLTIGEIFISSAAD